MMVGLHLLLVIGLLVLALALGLSASPDATAEGARADTEEDGEQAHNGQEQAEQTPDGQAQTGRARDEQGHGSAPLTISNLTASFINNNVTVTWRTNRPATTVFHYRYENEQDHSDWFTLKNLTLSRNHTLTTLLPFGHYRFYVVSTDEGGNRSVEDFQGRYYPLEHAFTEPLRILQVWASASAVMAGRPVTIYWTTNLPASAMAFADGSVLVAASPVGTQHWVTLTNTREFEGLAIEVVVQIRVSDGTQEDTMSFVYKLIKVTGATNSFQMSLPLIGLTLVASGVMMARNKHDPRPR